MINENYFSRRLLAVAANVKDAIDLKFSLVTGTAPQPDNGKISVNQDTPEWKNAETFARQFKVSRKELQGAFKYCNDDKCINEYQAEKKIEAASILLANGYLTIKEIAVELDYTQNYFSYIFKKHKGMTPTAWQRKNVNGKIALKS